MEIDKQKFRDLVEEDNMGAVLNQLSDISHFLGESAMQEELEGISENYQEYLNAEENGDANAENLRLAVKSSLLAFIDRLPDEFEPTEGAPGSTSGGCMGVLIALIVAGAGIVWLL